MITDLTTDHPITELMTLRPNYWPCDPPTDDLMTRWSDDFMIGLTTVSQLLTWRLLTSRSTTDDLMTIDLMTNDWPPNYLMTGWPNDRIDDFMTELSLEQINYKYKGGDFDWGDLTGCKSKFMKKQIIKEINQIKKTSSFWNILVLILGIDHRCKNVRPNFGQSIITVNTV